MWDDYRPSPGAAPSPAIAGAMPWVTTSRVGSWTSASLGTEESIAAEAPAGPFLMNWAQAAHATVTCPFMKPKWTIEYGSQGSAQYHS